MTVASDRINRLLGLTRRDAYLEIGVEQGHTFHAVESSCKTAVDPRFLFDVQQHKIDNPYCEYHEVTSDAYFDHLSLGHRFDLIFLDGLHRYEQAYRDLSNALMHLASGGIIVMDDTFPADLYSSNRDNGKALQLRREFAEAGPGWHGDTYKAVILIAIFNPLMDYCTVVGSGQKSQTFLWRRSDGRVCAGRPAADKYQEVVHNMESTHYMWLLENLDILNPCSSFAEVIDLMNKHMGVTRAD